mgnify:CR=1 FL=1
MTTNWASIVKRIQQEALLQHTDISEFVSFCARDVAHLDTETPKSDLGRRAADSASDANTYALHAKTYELMSETTCALIQCVNAAANAWGYAAAATFSDFQQARDNALDHYTRQLAKWLTH